MFLVACAAAVFWPAWRAGAEETVSLAGTWRLELDPRDAGTSGRWFNRDLADSCILPGSTDQNGYGNRNTRKAHFDYLSRVVEYVGPAWYQRWVDVPEAWRGKRITLVLERCHWETRVWVDAQYAGMQDSLCVPHVHDLSGVLTPGRHRLTIRVDNSHKYDMGSAAHSTSEQTQTNWNGIVGRIELRVSDPVWIDSLQVYPNIQRKAATVRLVIGNRTGTPAAGTVSLQAVAEGKKPHVVSARVAFRASAAATPVEAELLLGPEARLWDEFSPNLYQLTASLAGQAGDGRFAQEHRTVFGMRQLGVADNKQFALNGRRIYLRGTLECCIFPLTGYPPTDVPSWLRILKIAKSYGLNHLRFHSWCPPEAAFAAADQMGFIYHVECPQWVDNAGKVPPRDRFIEEELQRILDTYGNHPSFGLMCMGNELSGDPAFLQKLVQLGIERDPRHLYTPSTAWSFGELDQYRVMVVRGLHGPGTDFDFRDDVAKSKVPVVSHEIGQWTVYPNLEEIRKYTGVVRARNFELVRDDLAAKHLLDQAPDFVRATGRLSALLYKEEIEVLLRTPNHAGFQLLDLHDFPGQGTALVGLLDPFWDSKGIVPPEAHRRYCGPTVPLLRMKKRTFTTDETFTAQAEIAHFGPAALREAAPLWTITAEHARPVADGKLPAVTIQPGTLSPLGTIEYPLATGPAPAKLTVTVALQDTPIANDWEIWVYPARVEVSVPSDIVVSRSWDAATIAALTAGKKVLLLAPRAGIAKSLPGSFTPVFWSPIWFKTGPQTMGILCDPKHPALARFPTDFHTNWQWYDLAGRSSAMILDDTPADFRPIVQVIDNFSRNHKLGNLFEARVGAGRLMACSIDLAADLDQRPAARQLLHSILAYMSSEAFKPAGTLSVSTLSLIFRPAKIPTVQALGAKVHKVDSQCGENPATAAIDGDPQTCWHTEWQGAQPPHPHEIQIDLRKSVSLQGFRYLPRQEMANGRVARYAFYVSQDGHDWGQPVAQGTFANDATEKEVFFKGAVTGRYIRLVALSEVNGNPWASVAELDVIKRDSGSERP